MGAGGAVVPKRRGWPVAAGALGFAVLAPVSAAVMKALGVDNWWWLAGIAAAVGTAGGMVAKHFAARWERQVKERENRRKAVDRDALRGGRVRVGDITNPKVLRVHPARLPEGVDADDKAEFDLPVYVRRDRHDDVAKHLKPGGFVLIAGNSASGKTRLAFEVISTQLPEHWLLAPEERADLPALAEEAATKKKCVVWLDDLERFLRSGQLTTTVVDTILAGDDHHRVIVATIRSEELSLLKDDQDRFDDRHSVLGQATIIQLDDAFTDAELQRAEDLQWDPRIADALRNASGHLTEYIVAGPELVQRLNNASKTQPRGVALVAAAIDCRRAGWIGPLPTRLVEKLHTDYLSPRYSPETLGQAWEWAIKPIPRTVTALLAKDGKDVTVADYLVDHAQRTSSPDDHVPDTTVHTALDHADAHNAHNIGNTLRAQGRYHLAHTALTHALNLHTTTHDPHHPNTLTTRHNLAGVLQDLGQLEQARDEFKAVL
ncbi:Tetratricopeptide repeat-containing protein, partial [Saccharomonospora viridis]